MISAFGFVWWLINNFFILSPGASNLLSLWTDRIKSVHSKRHVEFSGRAQSDGNQAELYQNLNKQLQENSG